MNNKNRSSGLGFARALTIVFIILKLCNVINWSWWWVLSPILIDIAFTIIIIACFGIYELIMKKKHKHRLYFGERKKDKWNF